MQNNQKCIIIRAISSSTREINICLQESKTQPLSAIPYQRSLGRCLFRANCTSVEFPKSYNDEIDGNHFKRKRLAFRLHISVMLVHGEWKRSFGRQICHLVILSSLSSFVPPYFSQRVFLPTSPNVLSFLLF